MPLHVSSNKCSSSGGPTCVSTSSGITHSGGLTVWRSGQEETGSQFPPDRNWKPVSSWPKLETSFLLTETGNQFPPDRNWKPISFWPKLETSFLLTETGNQFPPYRNWKPISSLPKLETSFLLTGTSNSHPPDCVTPDDVLTQVGPPDDEHLLLETCRGMKQIHWEKCVKLVVNQNYVEMLYGQQDIKFLYLHLSNTKHNVFIIPSFCWPTINLATSLVYKRLHIKAICLVLSCRLTPRYK
jgi:hypothetical protein